VLAAFQLGAQKCGALSITGPDEFKQFCAQLAAQQGIRISNPELHMATASGPGERQPLPANPAAVPSPSTAYRMHKAYILSRIEVRNPERFTHARPMHPPQPYAGLDQPAHQGHRDRGKSTLNSHATCLIIVDTFRTRERYS